MSNHAQREIDSQETGRNYKLTLKYGIMHTCFVTGATGCIGHYVIKHLVKSFPTATIHALVRDTRRFKLDTRQYPNLHCHKGSMDEIGQYCEILKDCDFVIHIATVWGYNLTDNLRINRDRTMEMLNYLRPEHVKKIIYFSTASILTDENKLSAFAQTEGTPYVQSKLAGYQAIKASKWSEKVVTLFPTMVLGGGDEAPYSHISQGIINIRQYLWWAKWLKLNGAFHFLHAEDIAKMVTIAMTKPTPADMVLGTQVQSFNDTVLAICQHLNTTPFIQIPLPKWVIHGLVWTLGSSIDSWGNHCAKHPFFIYNTHSPADFGEPLTYPTFKSVLQGIPTI